jgi:hypothetical protein
MSRYDGLKAIPVSPWRWMALFAVIAELVYERVHAVGPTLGGHISSLGPGPSVLGAWTTVQLMLIWYGLVQLGELQRPIAAHDRMSRLVVLIAVLAGVTASVGDDLWLSATGSLAVTTASAVAYLRIRREIFEEQVAGWVGVPFSLLLGWTSIVSAAWILAAAGVANPAPSVTLIVFVAGTAMYLALHLRDFVLPGFVAWLLITISATDRLAPPIGAAALLAGALCSIVAIVIAATRISRSRPVASPSPSPRFPRA